MTEHLLGLRTVITHVSDLSAARTWYTDVLGKPPYFDEPFYVGFNVGGFELGLNPDTSKVAPGPGGNVAYWGVKDIDAAYAHFVGKGALALEDVEDVGGGIRVAMVSDPFGNLIGLIENPHFGNA